MVASISAAKLSFYGLKGVVFPLVASDICLHVVWIYWSFSIGYVSTEIPHFLRCSSNYENTNFNGF